MEQTCRICLEQGAELPIFQDVTNETLKAKISFCLHEDMEEVEGYPKNICQVCNSTLDVIYKFINTYKETCRILDGLKNEVKLQEGCEDEIFIEEAEVLSESDFTLAHIKLEFDLECGQQEALEEFADNEIKITRKSLKKDKNLKNKRLKRDTLEPKERKERGKRKVVRTNSIASSLLEAVYCWSDLSWSYANRTPTTAPVPAVREDTRRKCRVIAKRRKRKERPKRDPKRLCDLCGTVFADQTKLTKHKKKSHGGTRFKCDAPGCTKTCNTEFNLNKHQARRHGTKRDHVCSICGATFAFRAELTHHLKRHDSTYKRKVFSCSMCDKSYKTRKSVEIHERSVHTGLRPAACTVCSAAFFHEDYLKEHMRLHTGETPFPCPVCGRGYAQRANMKSHLRSHRLTELDQATRAAMKPNYLKLLKL